MTAAAFDKKFKSQFDNYTYSEISNFIEAIRFNFRKNTICDYETKYLQLYREASSELSTYLFKEHDGNEYVNAAAFYKLNKLSMENTLKDAFIKILNNISIEKQKLTVKKS